VVNVKVRKSAMALSLRGFKESTIADIRLKDCTFEHTEKPNVIESVEGLKVEGVTVNGKPL
jgi:hypothetical protein